MKENAYKILSELFQGGLNQKTAREVRLWFFRDADREAKDEALAKVWEEQIRSSEKINPEIRIQFVSLCRRLGIPVSGMESGKTRMKPMRRRLLERIAVAAAVMVFGIGIFSLYHWLAAPSYKPVVAMQTENGDADQASRTIELPCGSKVWLRDDSRIDIMDSQRELILDGEACFSVESNGEPFVVHTDHITVRVLGTVFNVNDSKNLDVVTVDLFDGLIELEAGGSRLALEKGEHFAMSKASLQWEVEDMPQNPGYPDWMQAAEPAVGGIAFNDILDILSRTYGIEVVNNRPDLAAGKYLFTPTDDMDIVKAMNTLKLLNNNFTYRIEDNILIID